MKQSQKLTRIRYRKNRLGVYDQLRQSEILVEEPIQDLFDYAERESMIQRLFDAVFAVKEARK